MDNSDKSKLMIAGVVIIVVIIIIILMRRKPTKPISSDPSVQVQEELSTIKDRVKGIEGYTTGRESYRSETNNGLTIGGTIMEQMIDVIIALLKQKEVAAALQKVVQRKEDAIAIAEVIEKLGKNLSRSIGETHVLKETAPGSAIYRVDQVEVQNLAKKMDQKLIEIMKSDKEKYFKLIVGIMKDNREFTTQPTMAQYDELIQRVEKDGFFDQSKIMQRRIQEANNRPVGTATAVSSIPGTQSVGTATSVAPTVMSGTSVAPTVMSGTSVGPTAVGTATAVGPMPATAPTVMSGTTEGYRMRY